MTSRIPIKQVRRPALCIVFAVALLGHAFGAATPAAAACAQWATTGAFFVNQQKKLMASPIEYSVQFQVNPGSGQLTGKAEYRPWATRTSATPAGQGPATGSIRGNRIEITANWGSHSVGIYAGTINAEGHASGTVSDRLNPSFKMEWHSAVPLSCAVAFDLDRPGGDYRNFDLSSASHDACLAACIGDAKCVAYSYVKPGAQGSRARCWLKNTRSYAKADGCCVSGVVRSASSAPAPARPSGGFVQNYGPQKLPKPGTVTGQAMPAIENATRPPSPSGAVTQFPIHRPRPVH